jgi:UDP-glucose 6-dehydrogenase
MTGIGAGAATNMVALEGATRDIAIAAKPGAIIVEKSTVPCRTAQIVRDTVSLIFRHLSVPCPSSNENISVAILSNKHPYQ